MESLNFIGTVILFILAVFSLLQLFIVFSASKYKVWKVKYKYGEAKYHQNLNVVVYSHNNAEAVVEQLENLKQQDYPLDKVKINIILDNCTDNSSNLLEILGGAKVWRISTGQKYVGRDAAFEWFLDRTLATENTNAFVFLDAKNRINPYLLTNINNAIGEFPVVIGRVSHTTGSRFLSKIIDLYDKLHFSIDLKGRSMAGLSNFLNTEIFAIRQEVLEKVRFISIDEQNTGMLYSMLLAKTKIPVVYSDEIDVFKRDGSTIKSFLLEKHTEFWDKVKAFFYGIHLLFRPMPIRCKELILSVLYPNDLVLVALFAVLFGITAFYGDFILGTELPKFVLSFCVVTTLYTIILSHLTFDDIMIWPFKILTAPIILFANIFAGINIRVPKFAKLPKLPALKFSLPKFKLPSLKRGPSKSATSVFVTNGTKDIPCQLEIKNDGGLYSAILWFNAHKLSSHQFLKASDALADLTEKLFQRGFALKACQNCGYFEPAKDGNHDFIDGGCLLGIAKHGRKEPYSTQIYYYCKFIVPAHARDYIRRQINDQNK